MKGLEIVGFEMFERFESFEEFKRFEEFEELKGFQFRGGVYDSETENNN